MELSYGSEKVENHTQLLWSLYPTYRVSVLAFFAEVDNDADTLLGTTNAFFDCIGWVWLACTNVGTKDVGAVAWIQWNISFNCNRFGRVGRNAGDLYTQIVCWKIDVVANVNTHLNCSSLVKCFWTICHGLFSCHVHCSSIVFMAAHVRTTKRYVDGEFQTTNDVLVVK